MTKVEMVNYLASIQALLRSHDDAGVARSRTLSREYDRVYQQLKDTIHKEEENGERRT